MLISKSNKLKFLLSLLIILNFYFVFLTGARGTLYSLSISSLIIFLSSNKNIKIKLLYFYTLIVISFIIYQIGLSITNFNEHSSHFKEIASSGRLHIYQTILPNIFKIKYFFNSVGFSSTDIFLVGFLHPHNLFLYIFLGSGTFGLMIFIYLIIKVFLKIYTGYISKSSSLYIKFITFTFMSVFIHSLVSGVYITPLTAIYLLYFFIVLFKSYSVRIYKVNDITTVYGINFNYSTIKSFISGLMIILIAIWYIYLIKVNLDFVIEYSNTKYSKNIPGVFLFNENVYR
jgi:hypothetical protein